MHFKPFCLVAVLLVLASVSFVEATPVHSGQMLVKAQNGGNNNAAAAGSSSNTVSSNNDNGNNASSDSNDASSNNSSSASSNNDNSSNDNSNSNSSSSDSSSASSTSSASAPARTRPCDQGDQSLAAALQANVVIALGQQASVITLQGISADQAAQEQLDDSTDSVSGIARRSKGNNNVASNVNSNSNSSSSSSNSSSNSSSSSSSNSGFSADFQAGVDRLNQFLNTSALAIQAAQAIADDDSFAQPQLGLLADQSQQLSLISSLTGDANTDNSTLASLLQLFVDAAGQSQDGAANALIDCFLPLTTVSG